MRRNHFFTDAVGPVLTLWVILSGLLTLSVVGRKAYAAEEGKTLFEQKCVACHTVGGGDLIGPDLKGVTERREAQWLKGFIQSPSSYLAKKDAIATGLLKKYGIPMPDLGLKENEVEAIIGYLGGAQNEAVAGVQKPSQYLPTLLLALGGVLALTFIGLRAGRKKVEVRG